MMTTNPEATEEQPLKQRKMIPVSRHWMECTEPDNITKFYYNISTGESSWVEPEEVRRTVRSLEQLGEQVSLDASKRQLLNTVDLSAWVERKDRSGRVFYFNTVTKASVWEMPAELRELRELSGETDASGGVQARKERDFVRMLEECGVGVGWSWEETLKEIIGHPSYKALSSLAERKTCFQKYIEGLRKRGDKRRDPRDDFMDSLVSFRLSPGARYSDVEDRLRRLECYQKLAPKERVDLFDRHVRDIGQQTRGEQMDRLNEYLYLQKIEFAAVRWTDIRDQLFARFPQLSKADCLSVWRQYILDSEKRAVEQAHREVKDRHRIEREAVANFKRVLVKTVSFNSKFSQLPPDVSNCAQYTALSEIGKELPLVVFLNVLDEQEEEYAKDREFIEHLKTRDIPFDQYIATLSLLNQTHVDSILGSHWRAFNPPVVESTQTADEHDDASNTNEPEKDKHRPQIDRYKHLLKHFTPPIQQSSAYKDYVGMLSRHEEFTALPAQLRQDYFVKFQLYLKRKHDQ